MPNLKVAEVQYWSYRHVTKLQADILIINHNKDWTGIVLVILVELFESAVVARSGQEDNGETSI